MHQRIGIGPEAVYIAGNNHHHVVITVNITIDLAAASRQRAVTPFIIMGAGLFQTTERFFSSTFTSREGAFTAGGGVRVRAGERVTVGVDARVGWEPHLRIGGVVGIELGRAP